MLGGGEQTLRGVCSDRGDSLRLLSPRSALREPGKVSAQMPRALDLGENRSLVPVHTPVPAASQLQLLLGQPEESPQHLSRHLCY